MKDEAQDEAREPEETFVVAPRAGETGADGATDAAGTVMPAAERYEQLRLHVANPDDPPVTMLRRDQPGGLVAGPYYAGTPGRMAIVQGQIYIVGVILVAQLFLVTTALYELLSGRTDTLWWIAGKSDRLRHRARGGTVAAEPTARVLMIVACHRHGTTGSRGDRESMERTRG